MKRRNSRWFWAIVVGTVVTVGGLVVYMIVVGLDKTNALSAPMIVLETLVLIGLTALLFIKPEVGSGDREANPAQTSRVTQRAEKGGRNYYAGRDLTIGEERSEKSDDVER